MTWLRPARASWRIQVVCGVEGEKIVSFYYDEKTKEVLLVYETTEEDTDRQTTKEGERMFENHLKKAKASQAAAASQRAVEDEDFEKKFPVLYAFLAATKGPDGEPRTTARVTIFADNGQWKASLVEVETEQSLFVTLRKPQDAFAALEKALEPDEPDWRAWRGAGRAGRGKKKGG